MKVECVRILNRLYLNGIINSTICHLNSHTLGLHDKTMRRFAFFLSKKWLTIFYNEFTMINDLTSLGNKK